MKKCRIVKRTEVDGHVGYVIQQKQFIVFWVDWVDMWRYDTLEEAKKNLCYFDGTEPKDEVVYHVNK